MTKAETQFEKTQAEKFKEAARQLKTDDDEARFEAKLRKVVKQKPKDDKKFSGTLRRATAPAIICRAMLP